MSEDNMGERGIDSIRIGGRRVGDLSVVDRMRARKQIELSKKERRIKDIKDRFPKYSPPHLRRGIREAKENIFRFETAIKKESDVIANYSALLALCEQRDKELKSAGVEV